MKKPSKRAVASWLLGFVLVAAAIYSVFVKENIGWGEACIPTCIGLLLIFRPSVLWNILEIVGRTKKVPVIILALSAAALLPACKSQQLSWEAVKAKAVHDSTEVSIPVTLNIAAEQTQILIPADSLRKLSTYNGITSEGRKWKAQVNADAAGNLKIDLHTDEASRDTLLTVPVPSLRLSQCAVEDHISREAANKMLREAKRKRTLTLAERIGDKVTHILILVLLIICLPTIVDLLKYLTRSLRAPSA